MSGNEDCPPPENIPSHPARLGEIYIGEDWKPGPIDWSGVPTMPTKEAQEAAMNYVYVKEFPQRKDCVGFLKAMTWTGIILTSVILLATFAFAGMIGWLAHEQAREESLIKAELAELAFYNQTHSNATEGSLTPPPPTYVPRFWEEHSTQVPNTASSPSSLGVAASATPVSHTTFMTRARAASEVSTTHTSSN